MTAAVYRHEEDGNGRTVQVWRLSDLTLLRTVALPAGPGGSEHQNPGELKLLEDGRRHRLTFKDTECAIPLRIGKFWVQTLSTTHALASFDLSDPAQIREASRLTFDDKQKPHWIASDQNGRRIVMNSGENGEHRLFIVNFDSKTGKLELDTRFRDPGSDRPGVSMDGKIWPHGFRGYAYAHGAVFSRAEDGSKR